MGQGHTPVNRIAVTIPLWRQAVSRRAQSRAPGAAAEPAIRVDKTRAALRNAGQNSGVRATIGECPMPVFARALAMTVDEAGGRGMPRSPSVIAF